MRALKSQLANHYISSQLGKIHQVIFVLNFRLVDDYENVKIQNTWSSPELGLIIVLAVLNVLLIFFCLGTLVVRFGLYLSIEKDPTNRFITVLLSLTYHQTF